MFAQERTMPMSNSFLLQPFLIIAHLFPLFAAEPSEEGQAVGGTLRIEGNAPLDLRSDLSGPVAVFLVRLPAFGSPGLTQGFVQGYTVVLTADTGRTHTPAMQLTHTFTTRTQNRPSLRYGHTFTALIKEGGRQQSSKRLQRCFRYHPPSFTLSARL